jgi:mediator of RNA polymerase II transcription subunit 13
LARQVYDRCPPATINKEVGAWGIDAAAAVRLETPLLKHVQFKLNAGLNGEGGGGAGSDLMRDPGFLNVAYAVSAGGEWCTAAWTDGVGRYQATASYCLIGRSFFEVTREIWQSCLGIMEGRSRVWRVCVSRVGCMAREEFDGKFSRRVYFRLPRWRFFWNGS